ncbi:MAG: UDP-N-acetylglucosamine--N-acetylmuramyl-(pentapeptide) pyrophosphoryl-undecaprenol N-acetylglucosamine transferase [Acidimicrobiales bacterium]|jgi:undecaprenyldiphospho-muramoylpentapeptide beta-N-acetylglucosaminyltransferase|nr:UDP-N-acetylglucosamine--N-acetylmuramyl-(pentapeptide) pyrophosphoryl-undecaprenol N-acetylglucosamine transferase [Acidimicrobiales bacterium]
MATSSGTYACIAGGGTAGHVLPGLAIARALAARGHPADSLHFVGSERGLERTLVPEAGFPLTTLPGRGLQRRLSLATLRAAMGILVGVWRGIGLIRRLRPCVVVALGGYASVPCVIGAVLWRVPIVVAEQNARAGLANRLAGRFARAAAVPFAETDLPRAVVTGNPVRPEVLALDRARDRDGACRQLGLPTDRIVVASFAGSLGSRRINLAVRGLADRWSPRVDVAVRHVVGSRDWDEGALAPWDPVEDGLVYQQVRYEDRMDLLLAAADIVVCRSGGTTVAELAEVGLPAVLVPLPIAPRDHQTANAQALVRVGAAVLVPDGELDAARLEQELTPLVEAPERLREMGERGATLARPDAADRVAALVEEHARHG